MNERRPDPSRPRHKMTEWDEPLPPAVYREHNPYIVVPDWLIIDAIVGQRGNRASLAAVGLWAYFAYSAGTWRAGESDTPETIESMARMLGISTSTVRKLIRELERAGALQVIEVHGPDDGREPNRYRLAAYEDEFLSEPDEPGSYDGYDPEVGF